MKKVYTRGYFATSSSGKRYYTRAHTRKKSRK